MSVFLFSSVSPLPINVAVTASTATTIVDATSTGEDAPVTVAWFSVNQTADTALNLTVDVYDGTNARYLGAMGSTWNAVQISGKVSVLFDDGYVIPKGSKLRVTSSNGSGLLHVQGVKVRGQS
jgi:hypothetical protein